jgi:Fe-S-cluster containining protein
MEHCLINGKRCTKCCEVLTINESKSNREWRSYARKVDFDSFEDGNKKELQTYWMIKKISRRKAKKINPHLVSIIKSKQSYFTCKHLTESGCNNYENRPSMCSGYPYYGKKPSEFIKEIKDAGESYKGKKGLYTDGCTYYIELK